MKRTQHGGRPRIDRHNHRIAVLAAAGLGKVYIQRDLTASGARIGVATVGRRLREIRQAATQERLGDFLATYE
jgi:hypothetical protein